MTAGAAGTDGLAEGAEERSIGMVGDKEPGLIFDGELRDAKLLAGKAENGQVVGGGIELALRLERPQPPKKPQRSWLLDQKEDLEPTKRAREEEEEFERRHAVWGRAHEQRIRTQESYDRDLANYEVQQAALRDRLWSYGQAVAMSSLLAGMKVTVSITPSTNGGQAALPGFAGAVLLLALETPAQG